MGHECFPYIDDSFVVADNPGTCEASLKALCGELDSLGFVIHQGKSVLEPSRKLLFLGFELDSEELSVSLTQAKKDKFERAAVQLLAKEEVPIRELAGLIGFLVAYSPAVEYGAAHFKWLEIDKNRALEQSKGNFEAQALVSDRGRSEVEWWLGHLERSRKVRLGAPEREICTDASLEGWGAHEGELSIGGRLLQDELEDHINVLELRAILLALRAFCKEKGEHVRVLTENTTVLAYVKNMGGVRSEACNSVAKQIWEYCESMELWVTIAHIPGVDNVLADFRSRNFRDDLEWEVSPKVFSRICKMFGTPEVDLFASRGTARVGTYVAWGPDPGAWRVDAFSFQWTEHLYYAFPPCSLVTRVIQKLETEKAKVILVAPAWATQPWYGRLKRLAKRIIHFRARNGNLLNGGKPTNRDFMQRCPLVACLFWPGN